MINLKKVFFVLPIILIIFLACEKKQENKIINKKPYEGKTITVIVPTLNADLVRGPILKNKKELVKKVLLVTGGKSYRVEEDGSCHKYAGFRYLFKEYGSYPPISSSIDGNLGWLYPNEISGTTPDYLVTIAATKELSKIGENQGWVVFGGFTALVKPGW